jgi:pilus assembly protein CpaB
MLRGILLLGIAALLGGVVVFLLRNVIDQQIALRAPAAPEVVQEHEIPLAKVVVATRELYFGDKLVADFIEEKDWPADLVPEGSFDSTQTLLQQSRSVIRPIAKGEPLLAPKLTGEGGRATLSAVVTDEMRAVTISINDILGVAGFVLPGDHVDILLTRSGPSGLINDIFLQNMKVLAIDQLANDQADKPNPARSVTFEATPLQVQKLNLAAQVGTLSLALRNVIDMAEAPSQTVTIADLNVGEINRSANQEAIDQALTGEAAGQQQLAKAQTATSSTPTTPVTETVPTTQLKVYDPFANITITRGTASSVAQVKRR